jgi:hypothetical protein
MCVNSNLIYYVNSLGEFHYEIDGMKKPIPSQKVNVNERLWAVIDIHGKSTAIELFDHPYNNLIIEFNKSCVINENKKATCVKKKSYQHKKISFTSPKNECIICFDKTIDAVLYKCGHMFMCYECAILLKNRGVKICPLCRADVKDVIRAYRS